LLAALSRDGFLVVRIKGSHHFLRHPDGRVTVVPVHAGESVRPGLLKQIMADCGLTRDALIRLL
jgi:predicted RNA binding protein YcfA (HicA-like mRNA interferase family)